MTDPLTVGQLDDPDELGSDELLELLDDDELDEDELLDELEEELLEELDEELDDDELGSSQHPSPKANTSHLQLSAKCLAKPYVPAGTLSALQQPPDVEPPQISGQTTPSAS